MILADLQGVSPYKTATTHQAAIFPLQNKSRFIYLMIDLGVL